MKNERSRRQFRLGTFPLALLLAATLAANPLRAADVTTVGDITTATNGTINLGGSNFPAEFGIRISGGVAIWDNGVGAEPLTPGTGTLTLGGDVTITTDDGSTPLTAGVYTTQNNLFKFETYDIAVTNETDGGMSAAFVYDSANPFSGTITGSGHYTSMAIGGGGKAFGMIFGNLATSSSSLLNVSDINGTITLTDSTINAISGDGGNAIGFLARDVRGSVRLGDINAISADGITRAGSAVGVEVGTVYGTLSVGDLTATSGNSGGGQANDARGMNLGGIANSGSVTVQSITSTTGTGTSGVMGYGINAGTIAGTLTTGTLTVDNQSTGQAIGIFTDENATGRIVMNGPTTITSVGTNNDWSATAFRAAADTGVGKRVASLQVNGPIDVTATDGVAFGLFAGSFENLTINNTTVTVTGDDGAAAVYTDGATGNSNVAILGNSKVVGTGGYSVYLGGVNDTLTFNATGNAGAGGTFNNGGAAFTGREIENLVFSGTNDPNDPNTYLFTAGSRFFRTNAITVAENAEVTMSSGAFDTTGVRAVIDGKYTSGGAETFIDLQGTSAAANITMNGTLTLQNTIGTSSSYAGTITGGRPLTKTGFGTQFLPGEVTVSAVDIRAGVLDFGGKVTGTTLNVANGATARFDGTKGSTFSGAGSLNTSGTLRVYGEAAAGTIGLDFGSAVSGLSNDQTVGRSQFTRWYYDAASYNVLSGNLDSAYMSDARVSTLMMHKWNTIWTASNDRLTQNLRYWQVRRPAYYRGQSQNKRNVLSGHSVWVNYVGRANQLDSNYYQGNRYLLTSDGVQVGFDIYSSRTTQLGIMFGYEREGSAILADRVKADDLYLGLYGARVFSSGCDLRGYVGYGHQSYDMTRWAEGFDGFNRHLSSFSGNTIEGTLELGRRLYCDSFISFRPVIALDFYNNEVDGAAEDGDRATAVGYSRTSLTQTYLRLGSDFQWNIRRLNFNAGGYYSVQLLGDGDSLETEVVSLGGGQAAGLYGTGLGSSVFTFTIGGQYYLCPSRRCAVFGNYYIDAFADRGSMPVQHTGMIGLQYRF